MNRLDLMARPSTGRPFGDHCDFFSQDYPPYMPSSMISWKSNITNKCLSLAFRAMRNTSVQSELEKIRDEKEKWAEDFAPPARVLDDRTTTHTLEHLGRRKEDGGKIGDHWPVYHFRSQSSGNGTDGLAYKPVVVYFHSGGFYGQWNPIEWQYTHNLLVKETGHPTVFPVYTLAPYATAGQVIRVAIDLLISISEDSRYVGRDIVLMGSSAGGWIALRLALALSRLALGDEAFDAECTGISPGPAWDLEKIRRVRRAVTKMISVSGALGLSLDSEEEVELGRQDIMLNRDVVLAGVKLWAYGPAGIPEFDVKLPADATSLAEPAHSLKYSLQDGRFDLHADCHVLQQYHDHPQIDDKSPLRILAAVGTADLTCIGNRRVVAALQRLTLGAVEYEYREYPDMCHAFAMLFWLQEAKDLRRRLTEFLGTD